MMSDLNQKILPCLSTNHLQASRWLSRHWFSYQLHTDVANALLASSCFGRLACVARS